MDAKQLFSAVVLATESMPYVPELVYSQLRRLHKRAIGIVTKALVADGYVEIEGVGTLTIKVDARGERHIQGTLDRDFHEQVGKAVDSYRSHRSTDASLPEYMPLAIEGEELARICIATCVCGAYGVDAPNGSDSDVDVEAFAEEHINCSCSCDGIGTFTHITWITQVVSLPERVEMDDVR